MAKIITIRQVRDFPFLSIEGQSGKQYRFDWDDKAQAYAYETGSAEEVDDLAYTQGPNAFFYFSFRGGDTLATAKPKIESGYYNELSQGELIALCKDVGIRANTQDSSTTLKRLLDAFFLGAGSK
jgi:hypothetical protein